MLLGSLFFCGSESTSTKKEMSSTQSASGTGTDGGATLPTIGEIRAVFHQSCFLHSVFRALWEVVRDAPVILAVFGLAVLLFRFPGKTEFSWFDVLGWTIYGFAQGTAMMGWWVLGHECGHGGFSQYRAVNDTVGWILHSALLVPHFSWQYSHGNRMSDTNDLTEKLPTVPDTDGCSPHVDNDNDVTPSMHKVSVQEVASTLAAIKLTLVNKINGGTIRAKIITEMRELRVVKCKQRHRETNKATEVQAKEAAGTSSNTLTVTLQHA